MSSPASDFTPAGQLRGGESKSQKEAGGIKERQIREVKNPLSDTFDFIFISFYLDQQHLQILAESAFFFFFC